MLQTKDVKQMKWDRKNRIEGSTDMAFCGILIPDEKQEELIRKTLGCKRYIYNQFLNERIEAYKAGLPLVSYMEQAKQLPLMKKDPKTIWLSEVDSTALQNSAKDLQTAFDNFFRGIKEGKKIGFPKFKCKHDYECSYRTTNNNNAVRVIDKYHICCSAN
jgi:putative transposase